MLWKLANGRNGTLFLISRPEYGIIRGMGDNLKIPYGVADFKRICEEGFYYIDKTGYIPLLEQAGSFLFFVRPRRFVRLEHVAEEAM